MTCQDLSADILALAEGRLEEPRRSEIEAHVARCSGCRHALADQQDVARVLASRPEAAPPASFAARVAAELEEANGWYGFVDWRWLAVRMAPVAGALLIAGAIAVEHDATIAASAGPESLSQVVESWASGGGESTPATSVLWQKDVSDDSMLLTVLAAPPDAAIGGQSDER